MNADQLSSVLTEALKALPNPQVEGLWLNIRAYEANLGGSKADGQIIALISALRSESELEVFNGSFLHVVPNGAHAVEFWHLAVWLIRRASTVGPAQAVEDLRTYLDSTELACEVVLAISGFAPEKPTSLGRGISFLPWQDVRNSSQKQSVHERSFSAFPPQLLNSALVCERAVVKRYIPQSEFNYGLNEYGNNVDERDLHDAFMCLALSGPYSPQILASWVTAPVWAPVISGSMWLPTQEGFAVGSQIPLDKCNAAADLLKAFGAVSGTLDSRIRLVMQRLLRAMRRTTSVDSAIDLGICLEALFLGDKQDDRGKISFRLSTRAARFLGMSESDRRRIFDLVGGLYKMRSIAVHTGALDPQFRKRPVQEFLNEGFEIVATTLRRYVIGGEPNWDQVLFG
jgi:hypothetical protein